jgi:hypothetical protein
MDYMNTLLCMWMTCLGCDYFHDKDGTLCYGPHKFIIKILDQFKNMFGCKPKEYTSPLEKGDNPEIDS